MGAGDNKTECGHILRSLRQEAQLSLRELAKRVNMHHTYMGLLENGQRSLPSPPLMERLGKALGTSYEVIEWATKGKRLRPWINVLSPNPKNAPLILKLSLRDEAPSSSEIGELVQALRTEAPGREITLKIPKKGVVQGGVLEDLSVKREKGT